MGQNASVECGHMALLSRSRHERSRPVSWDQRRLSHSWAVVEDKTRTTTALPYRRSDFKLGLVQMLVGDHKADNVDKAVSMVTQAATQGAQLVVLPELFTTVIHPRHIVVNCEPFPGPTSAALATAAKDNGIYLVGGSIPEKASDDKIYSMCAVFNPEGDIISVYRKIHLFSYNAPEARSIQESLTISPGNDLAFFDTPYCRVGLSICYDIRFMELAHLYAQKGCKLLLCPSAFSLATGQAHWTLVQRMRAVDNQMCVAMISPARDESVSYVIWGHSSVVSPWGEVIVEADHTEAIVYADIDLSEVDGFRDTMPLNDHRRNDLYRITSKQFTEI